ncbi:hypothetical protein L0Y34_02255 [Candidatus Parcubacteria bacterium]|nr:hypothetical protein [Candidatus Parcubacteria bacterium]
MNKEPKISILQWVLLAPVWFAASAVAGTFFLVAGVTYLDGAIPPNLEALFASPSAVRPGIVVSYLLGALGSAMVIGQSLGYREDEHPRRRR